VVYEDNGYSLYDINLQSKQAAQIGFTYYLNDEIKRLGSKSRAIRDFINWSRYPIGWIKKNNNRLIVKLSDLRSHYGPVMLRVEFKGDAVVSERFGFRMKD